MKLRRSTKQTTENSDPPMERKTSKRHRIAQFFRSRKRKQQQHDKTSMERAPPGTSPVIPPTDRVPGGTTTLQPRSDHAATPPAAEAQPALLPTPPPEVIEKEKEKIETLDEAQLQVLFSGAPTFSIQTVEDRATPTVTYPWNSAHQSKGLSDSLILETPAFTAATLHKHAANTQQSAETGKAYSGYDVDVVELPNMLTAQGTEPGSIGFALFLESPKADSLVTDLEESQSSKSFLQGTRNKELMQSNPERLGIRAVDINLVYDRLVEFQDMYEAFHKSPEPMTILNNQKPGDLYANLFSKFLTPPGYDGSTEDPSGLKIQISTLFRVLGLKGVWYDFSLVEWRIRLGQLIWSDPEPVPEHERHPLWTEREILFLQITLACELLVRLDAISIANAHGIKDQIDITLEDIAQLVDKKSKKVSWDLVLARRFLDNILVVKSSDLDPQKSELKSRGFLSMIGVAAVPEMPKSDIILLPQHQTRQLSGLLKFAETMRWPNSEGVLQELVQKLGAQDSGQKVKQLPSPIGMAFDPITPSSISIYGTPLQTPRSGNHLLDGYFGHIGKPVLSRNNSRSLRIPLSRTLSALTDNASGSPINVGGWLSRSYLTGLVLPGEAIQHLLISTLLENDSSAIARLGDSANLYGGFSYAGKTWWSKNSIVARVLACLDGAVECMGWISFSNSPAGFEEGWHSIHSEQLPLNNRMVCGSNEDLVARDSAIVPVRGADNIKSADLVLPSDLDVMPLASLILTRWDLSPLNMDLIDGDALSDPPPEEDVHVPSVTFSSTKDSSTHTLTLAFDVQFITSWPCTSPSTTPISSLPHALKRSLTGTVSRSSSKRSASTRRSRRNSHGYEPLLSHPPDSADIAPQPLQIIEIEDEDSTSAKTPQPMHSHPLHISYKYVVVPVTDVLAPEYTVPFDMHAHKPMATPSASQDAQWPGKVSVESKETVLVLDARSSIDLQLLARAWCAEKGYNAIIGRASRTCLACCIREARGLGLNVVIRV